jgi:hypothetical protein
MKKLILIIFVIISALSALFVAACDKDEPIVDDNFYDSWMQYIKDDVKLINTVLPGSHDAGSEGLLFFMDTQHCSIAEQLEAGSRYLDLRVKYNRAGKLAMFHGSQTGPLFDDVLNMLITFIEENPSEFLVLDFQHFETPDPADLSALIIAVEEAFSAIMKPDEYALKKGMNLSTLTMGEIRAAGARYIVTWGRDEDITLGKNYIFRRDDYLDSPYVTEEHQDDWTRLMNYFPNYFAVNVGTKLFVLQCQPTSGDIDSFNSEYTDAMNAYAASLADNSELLMKTNIIMRDNVIANPETMSTIIRLNLSKNNVKAEYIEYFTDSLQAS